MIKDISFGGFSATPDDYLCADGELDMAMQVVSQDGRITRAPQFKTLFQLPVQGIVHYVHEGTTGTIYKHYIVERLSDHVIGWVDDATRNAFNEPLFQLSDSVSLYGVNSIGNCLLLLTSQGPQHLLWQNGSYHLLGSRLPSISLDFSLSCYHKLRRDVFLSTELPEQVSRPAANADNKVEEKWRTFSSSVKGTVNALLADVYKNGQFVFPFFVRYALRLNDEASSLACHSAPILMLPSMLRGVWAFAMNNNESVNVIAESLTAKLQYCFNDIDNLDIDKWRDIIRSVDIFISAPVYTYDEAHDVESYKTYDQWSADDNTVAYYGNYNTISTVNNASDNKIYRKRTYSMPPEEFKAAWERLVLCALPEFTEDYVIERLRSVHDFYLLKSIPLEELKNNASKRIDITLERDYLTSLVNRERMTDDYDTNDTIIPQYSFVYNQRVNYANLSKILFDGYSPASSFFYLTSQSAADIYVRIREDAREIWVKSSGSMSPDNPLAYFYYPNIKADLAVICIGSTRYALPLRPHDFLNGACAAPATFTYTNLQPPTSTYNTPTSPYNTPTSTYNTSPSPSSLADRTLSLPNKLYTSEVGNPFYFPVTNINTIGVGRIIGLSSAVTALSPGQFGQFPLYVFTSEGVWSLTVNSTGGWDFKQVTTRDVCTDPSSITQIDGAVIFVTSQGLMLLEGAQSTCISDTLDDTLDSLPSATVLGSSAAEPSVSSSSSSAPVLALSGASRLPALDALIFSFDVPLSTLSRIPFKTYLQQSRILNDYANRRIIVFNPSYDYAYCFNRKGKTWTFLASSFLTPVNSYPEALALDRDYNIIDISNTDPSSDNQQGAAILTRPLKLDAPDLLKTVRRILLRGINVNQPYGICLYGSRDMDHWSIVAAVRGWRIKHISGSPYKYFRLAVFIPKDINMSLTGFTVEYEPRHTNRLR
ncbi:MAG: hypothetical protein ACI4T5_03255 [Prevotella sp.]